MHDVHRKKGYTAARQITVPPLEEGRARQDLTIQAKRLMNKPGRQIGMKGRKRFQAQDDSFVWFVNMASGACE